MRISYNWLKDYIKLTMAPEKLAGVLTMAGLSVDSVKKTANDTILEIEVTSNRPDWLSYIGVAREIVAITGGKFKIPFRHCEPRRGEAISKKDCFVGHAGLRPASPPRNDKKGLITIKIDDKNLCPRYTARIMRDVKAGESPAWLKERLEAMDLRPVNNVVDITNFCLFETGEPMHAFDLDRIEDGRVIVRKARAGEKITTIDGVVRTLDDSVLVIADSFKPIAIAGVMGGLNTEVTPSTKNILLEAAYFDPISVRRTSRKLGISSESSYRFERRVDPSNIKYSSDRAASLIMEIAGGSAGEFIDIGSVKETKKSVNLRYPRCAKIIGVDVAQAKIKNILSSLGLKIKAGSKNGIKLEIPRFRHDLRNEIDIIEEVARIYGYDNIPTTIPHIVEESSRLPVEMVVDNKIRENLAASGMDEIMTYSLLGRKALSASAVQDEGVVEVTNALTSEQEVMRPSLIAGMLTSLLWNINRKTKDLALFELGNIYIKGQNAFTEKKHLSMAIAGEMSSWLGGTRRAGFYDLKGTAESVLSSLGISGVSFKETSHAGFSRHACAEIVINGIGIGFLGEVSAKIAANFDIKEKVFYCEMCVDAIAKHAVLEKHFSEIPRFHSVSRDISIVVSKAITNDRIEALVKDNGVPILKTVRLIDRYTGKQIPDGKESLTYRLEYQDTEKTLTDKDITDVHSRILRALGEKIGAKLR